MADMPVYDKKKKNKNEQTKNENKTKKTKKKTKKKKQKQKNKTNNFPLRNQWTDCLETSYVVLGSRGSS